jgi:hypothetical protein
MSNIDLFNTIVGLVLGDLYETFPAPRDIHAHQYAERLGISTIPTNGHFTIEEQFPAIATIKWLIDENYVRCNSTPKNISDMFHQVVLSSKGLQLLSMPESLDKSLSIGNQMSDAIKNGAFDSLKDLAKSAICEGGKLIVQAGLQAIMAP